jgi:putative aldouronate transport system permease protein
MIDGASRLQRILNIDLPTLMPTAILLLILEFGRLMSIGFDRLYLLQTPLNLPISEVIPTYIYKVGVMGTGAMPRYSFGTAIGLFQSFVNLVLILVVNKIVKKYSEHSLF